MESILLINGGCGRAQPILGDAIPGQVILDDIQKQAEQATRGKPVGGVVYLLLQFCL